MSEQTTTNEENCNVTSLSSRKPLLRFPTIHPARKERIGDSFQAKPVSNAFDSEQEYAIKRSRLGGELEWSFEKMNHKSVAEYIGFTNGLIPAFRQGNRVDLALNVLKKCDYNVQSAVEILRPVTERGNRSAALEAHFKLQGRNSIIKPNSSGNQDENARTVRNRASGSFKPIASSGANSVVMDDLNKQLKEKTTGKCLTREEILKKTFLINPELCYVCKDGGDIICCEKPGCNRSYHLDCYGIADVPKNQWICRAHSCDVCGEKVNPLSDTDFTLPKPYNLPCQFCARVFCPKHKINISERENSIDEYVCDACSTLISTDQDYFEWHLFSFHRALNPESDAANDTTSGGNLINLFKLYNIVDKHGGIKNIGRSKSWKEVFQYLEITSPSITSTVVRRRFRRMLAAYRKCFCASAIEENDEEEMEEPSNFRKKEEIVKTDILQSEEKSAMMSIAKKKLAHKAAQASASAQRDFLLIEVGNSKECVPEDDEEKPIKIKILKKYLNGVQINKRSVDTKNALEKESGSVPISPIRPKRESESVPISPVRPVRILRSTLPEAINSKKEEIFEGNIQKTGMKRKSSSESYESSSPSRMTRSKAVIAKSSNESLSSTLDSLENLESGSTYLHTKEERDSEIVGHSNEQEETVSA